MKTHPFHPCLSLVFAAVIFSTTPTHAQNGESDAAPGFTAPPAIENIGGSSTVAAYSPPHEQVGNPADDADDVNDSRTREAFTRPIYLRSDNLNPSGNPIRPPTPRIGGPASS